MMPWFWFVQCRAPATLIGLDASSRWERRSYLDVRGAFGDRGADCHCYCASMNCPEAEQGEERVIWDHCGLGGMYVMRRSVK